jgi:hypothetical protein
MQLNRMKFRAATAISREIQLKSIELGENYRAGDFSVADQEDEQKKGKRRICVFPDFSELHQLFSLKAEPRIRSSIEEKYGGDCTARTCRCATSTNFHSDQSDVS